MRVIRKTNVLTRIRAGEHTVIIVLAFIIGLLAGAANVVFRYSLDFVHNLIFVRGSELLHIDHGGFYTVLIPLLPITGALLLIPFSLLFPGEVNGYGLPRFLETVNIKGGRIKLRSFFLKIIGSALTIGSGGSAGIEGPIAIIGGTVGSAVASFFRSSGNRLKLLIAAGAAGGIAATFNAPIAGVMFATEIILLGNFELSSFAAVIISSGIATVVSRGVFGASPAFSVPQYELRSPLEIPLYMVLGLVVAFVAVFYIKIFYRIKDRFSSSRIHPQLKPVVGALIVGIIGIGLPQVLGNGYDTVQRALEGKVLFPIIFLIIIFKILATSITLGSGGAGGVFAPALLIGSMTGGSFGYIVNYLFPRITASPGAYATVGIGAFLAATVHAPLTGIFLLFEMTGNYKIIIPLMFASIIGSLLARRLYPDSIDTVELTRKGIKVHAGMDVSIMNRLKVKEVMSNDFVTVREETPLRALVELMTRKERFYVPVVNSAGIMTGIVSFQDVKQIMFIEKVKERVTAFEIATEKVATVLPDDDLHSAMEKFALLDIEEIPVVDPGNPGRVIAFLSQKNLIEAYNKEILKNEHKF